MSPVTYQSTIVQLEPFGGINHYWEYISIADYQENVKREHVKLLPVTLFTTIFSCV